MACPDLSLKVRTGILVQANTRASCIAELYVPAAIEYHREFANLE